ncbi:MAG: 2-C-methyl-D-erythritol 2,4-cyclodiphosphate synthase [Bacilli bacterium]|nr:2-C-methyl-D-erythritol 2,4-cyclodiphosphate synthase [Bacilli bacterium]
MYRIGFSEDIHPVKKGRKLVLGGVEIPNADGLDGHSDADVVLHAVCESILGALALGDLGKHFPDTDPQYKDISSVVLLEHVYTLMKKEGAKIGNIDIQVAASKPKLAPYLPKMRKLISQKLHTRLNNVSIKAMSFNSVGPIGEGKAIKAQVIVLLDK